MLRAAAHLTTGLGLLLALAVAPAAAADPPPPDGARGGSDSWQRQQPTRERTRELLREEGIARDPETSRGQLRSLNALSDQLLPEGAKRPAPSLGGEAGRR